jgi:hypothetical protein
MLTQFRAFALGALLACPLLGACSAAPAAPAAAANGSGAAATPEALARQYLALVPGWARGVGLHEYDGKIADVSAAGIERRISTLREFQQLAARGADSASGADERLDWSILRQVFAQDQ